MIRRFLALLKLEEQAPKCANHGDGREKALTSFELRQFLPMGLSQLIVCGDSDGLLGPLFLTGKLFSHWLTASRKQLRLGV